MAKRVKRKVKVKNVLRIICIILILSLVIYILLNSKINNIVISGNNYLTDDQIIEEAGLKDYPSFFFTF